VRYNQFSQYTLNCSVVGIVKFTVDIEFTNIINE